MELVVRQRMRLFASKLVLREADRNLRKKGTAEALKSFHRFLQKAKIQIVPFPDEKIIQPLESFIHPKDVPVFAACVQSKANFFITLDRKYFLTPTALSKIKGIKLMSPGDFIREIYLKGKI